MSKNKSSPSPIIMDDTDEYEEIEYEEVEGGNDKGCLWGLLGASGCMVLPLGAIAFLVIMGINTLDGVADSIIGIFDPPPATYSTVNETLVLERVQALANLTTIRYNYSQTITTQRDLPDALELFYGEQITLLAVGHINAGVDLDALGADNITLNEGVLSIRLPPPTLQDCILNAQQTQVVSSDTGLFTSDSDIETQTRQVAIRRIRDVALEQGILGDANANAAQVLEQMLSLSLIVAADEGTTPVSVRVETSPVPVEITEYPETCR